MPSSAARAAVARFGRIDVWVNNAGVIAFAPFEETPPDVFRRVVDVNLHGYVHGARAALAQFREQGGGTLTLTPVGQASVTLANSGAPGDDFAIGGSIDIAPTTVDGVYTGTVDVKVDYN